MRTSSTAAVLSLACVALAAAQSATAAEADGWAFEATPYLLAAGMNGTVGVRGFKTNVDASASEVMDSLDGAFLGVLSAQKGRWLFALEAVYLDLGDSGSKQITSPNGIVSVNGQLEASSTITIYQGSAGYRIVDDRTKVDLMGALRYTKLEADLEIRTQFTPGVVFPDKARSIGGSDSWTDVVAGMRVLHPVTDTVTLMGYVDVGGGGSDLTYQAMAGANWEFAKDFSAKIGYRHMYWDYEEDGTVWDIAASGPYLGLGIRF